MRKNKLALLLLAVLILLGIIGCEKGGGEIKFWMMPNAPHDMQVAWLKKVSGEFEAKTGTKVVFEEVGWGDAFPRITAALTTGEGADVFQVGTTWNPQLAATGGMMEINIKEFGGADSFLKANLDSTYYKGKNYGVPWFAETRALYYNKDMFADAGVEPPKTYEELMEVGKKIIEKQGEGTAIAIVGTTAWDLLQNWSIILMAYGGNLVTDDYSKAILNEEPGIISMQWYVDLVRNGLASTACAEYNTPQADSAFNSGNVAMVFSGPWGVANIADENPDLNYGVVEPPAGPAGKASFAGGSNLAILNSSKYKKQAKAWVKFIIKEETLLEYTKIAKLLPCKMKAFDDPYYSSGTYEVFKNTINYATAYPALGVWGTVETAIVDELKNVLADYIDGNYNDQTVKKYLDIAAERVDQALSEEQ